MKSRVVLTSSRLTVIFVVAALVSCFAFCEKVTAGDWLIIADENLGLVSKPKDASGGNSLFNVGKMSPGDICRAGVELRNECTFSYSLSVEIRGASGNGLIGQFIIRAYLDGALLADFPQTVGTYMFSDKFLPGSVHNVVFEIELPGEPTTNEFQNSRAQLNWVFTANADYQDPEPSPPPTPAPEPGLPPPLTPGSGFTPSFIPNPQPEAVTEYFSIDGETDPLGSVPVPEPEAEVAEYTELIDDDTALGAPEMPKTGEAPLWQSAVSGAALVSAGITLFTRGRKRGESASE